MRHGAGKANEAPDRLHAGGINAAAVLSILGRRVVFGLKIHHGGNNDYSLINPY